MKMALLLFSIAMVQFIDTKCTFGCLKCDSEDKCLFCDPTQKYRLQDGECESVVQDNCLMIDFNGNCYVCDKDFYLDGSTKKCVAVPANSLINDCLYYSTSISCQSCRKNYYIKGSTCQQIVEEELIGNCEFYSTQTSCQECEAEYILSQDKKECTANPGRSNCAFYSRGFCEGCDTGYFLNYQYYTEKTYQFKTDEQKKRLTLHINELILGRPSIKFVEVCEKLKTTNCLVPRNAKACAVCNPGYLLDDGTLQCLPFPKMGIINCLRYSSETVCTECSAGYHLASSSTCTENTAIDNCNVYNGTSQQTKCLLCGDGFYSAGSTCSDRKNSIQIDNCSSFDPLGDKCASCADGFIIVDDLKCLVEIANCVEQAGSGSNSVACTKCSSGFYLQDSQNCLSGNVPNCDQYNFKADDCSKCLNSFFLKNGICESHDVLNNCDDYSITEQDTCLTCSDNSYNFKVNQLCVFHNAKSNCVKYNDRAPLTCTECEPGWFVSGNSCDVISVSNCAVFDGKDCTSCLKNYALDTSEDPPTCSNIFSYLHSNCVLTSVEEEDSNSQTLEQAFCKVCDTFNYPINHQNQYVCVRND